MRPLLTLLALALLALAGGAKRSMDSAYDEMSYYAEAEEVYDYDADGAPAESVAASAPARSSSKASYRASAGAPPPPPPAPPSSPDAAEPAVEQPADAASEPASEARMIHYNGWARLRVTRPEEAADALVGIAEQAGGYVESLTSTSVTLRVPVARFEELFKAALAVGDVLDKGVTAEDITDSYLAVDLRLRTSKATRDRLMELLAKAKDEKEKMSLLQQIQRLTEQIDVMEAQLRTLAGLAAFSRISVELVPRAQFSGRAVRDDVAGFGWINGLSPLRRDLDREVWPLRLDVPEGMVALDLKRRFVAESPDGAVIWTARVANDPEGTTAFWLDAITGRLSPEFRSAERSAVGAWALVRLEDVADEPYLWVIGVRADGRRLDLVQIYYPSAEHEARYGEALRAALTGVGMTAPRLALAALLALAAPLARAEDAPAPAAKITASLTVKVAKRDEAADALIAAARARGGYFTALSRESVSLRVPGAQTDGLLSDAAALGLVVDRGFSRSDLSAALTEKRALLASREGMLERYYGVLDEAGVESVVAVERQILQVVATIETLKGELRVLEQQAAWADVAVSFQFRERDAPVRDGSSSFAWLNRLNLADLVAGFRASPERGAVGDGAPAGFAPFRGRSRDVPLMAATADGALYRERTWKHKPHATLAYWQEAMKNHMVAAGYRVLSEQTVGGDAGAVLESAPLGDQDMTYVVAVFPEGGRLRVVEAAGEITRFGAHRDAVFAALGADPSVRPEAEATEAR